MARMYFYVLVAIVLTMMMNLLAIDIQGDGNVLDKVGLSGFMESGNVLDFSAGVFFSNLFGTSGILIIVAAGAGIIISLFSRSQPENYVILPFITVVLATFVGTLWSVLLTGAAYDNWIRIPLIILMGPFTIGYILSMVEWFRGNV